MRVQMKKKQSKINNRNDEEGYRISGWNSEEDPNFSDNILKILQKKITLPALDSHNSRPIKSQLPQNLPTVPQYTQKQPLIPPKFSKDNLVSNHPKPLLPIRSQKQILSITQPKRGKVKSVDAKIKSLQRQQITQAFDSVKKKQKKYGNLQQQNRNFMKSHNKFLYPSCEKKANNTKRSQQIWLQKHNKMKSIQAAKLKQCEPIFLQKGHSLKMLKRKEMVRYENKTHKQVNSHNLDQLFKKIKSKEGKSLKLKTENGPQDRLTRMIWMEQFLGDRDSNIRNCKTLASEERDFQDTHMQFIRKFKKIQ